MNEIKDLVHYFSREDHTAIPSHKTEINKRLKYASGRISIILMGYLYCKGFEDANINNIDSFLSKEELIANTDEKVAEENKQNDLVCCRKLSDAFLKNKKVFNNIIDCKFGRDCTSMHTLLKLPIAKVKIRIQFIVRSGDVPIPSMKKALLE